jgi:hypothetical protein
MKAHRGVRLTAATLLALVVAAVARDARATPHRAEPDRDETDASHGGSASGAENQAGPVTVHLESRRPVALEALERGWRRFSVLLSRP